MVAKSTNANPLRRRRAGGQADGQLGGQRSAGERCNRTAVAHAARPASWGFPGHPRVASFRALQTATAAGHTDRFPARYPAALRPAAPPSCASAPALSAPALPALPLRPPPPAHLCVPSNLRGSRQLLTAPKGVNRPRMSLRVASKATFRTTIFVVSGSPPPPAPFFCGCRAPGVRQAGVGGPFLRAPPVHCMVHGTSVAHSVCAPRCCTQQQPMPGS